MPRAILLANCCQFVPRAFALLDGILPRLAQVAEHSTGSNMQQRQQERSPESKIRQRGLIHDQDSLVGCIPRRHDENRDETLCKGTSAHMRLEKAKETVPLRNSMRRWFRRSSKHFLLKCCKGKEKVVVFCLEDRKRGEKTLAPPHPLRIKGRSKGPASCSPPQTLFSRAKADRFFKDKTENILLLLAETLSMITKPNKSFSFRIVPKKS